jgi:uncharacterized iron-regulated membrane protein
MTPETLTPEAPSAEPLTQEVPTPELQVAETLAAARRQGAAHVDERPNENHTSSAKLYRLFWRWHFYAGLIVAPIILVASVTGGLYVFIEELRPLMYPTLFQAESTVGSGPMLSHAELAAAVEKNVPNAKVTAVTPPADETQNARVEVTGKPTQMVDPRTGEVAGFYDEKNSFFGIVLGLHRRLLLDTPGRITVEMAVSWGVILLITGVYLWWPRKSGRAQSPGAGVWYPRLRMPLTVVLRDLHTVVGFYGVTTASIVLITGLFFTQFFGNGYKLLQNNLGYTPPSAAKPPTSSEKNGRTPISLDEAKRIAEPLLPGSAPLRINVPKEEAPAKTPGEQPKPGEAFNIARADSTSPTLRRTVFIDQYSGQVLDSYGWDDLSTLHKIRFSIYPIHVGSIYGLTTKILALLTCMALMVLAITGVWMWWRRRPKGTWGLAPSTANIAIPRWLSGTIVGLAIVMPAFGISLIAVLLGDFAVTKYLARRAARAAA